MANYTNHGLAFLTAIFLARLLNPADFGLVATATSIAALACLPLEWGAAQNLLTDRSRNAALYCETLSLGLLITIAKAAVCLLLAFYFFWTDSTLMALLFASASLPVVVSTVAGILRCAVEATGNFRVNFTNQAVSMLFGSAVGLSLAFTGFGVWSLIAMGLAASIPQFFLYPPHVPHIYHWQLSRKALIARGKNGFWLWLIQSSGNAYRHVDRLLLSHSAGSSSVGNYTRALNYTQTSSLLFHSLLSHPSILSFTRAESGKQVIKILASNSLVLVIGSTASFILFYFFSDPLVPFVFGNQWAPAIPVFQAFAPINFCIAFFFLPQNFLHARRAYAFTAWARLGALAFLVISLLATGKDLTATKTATFVQIGYTLAGIACWIELFRVYRKTTYPA
jgi:teichuronic acid exporter